MPDATSLASPPGSSIAFALLAITLFLFFVSATATVLQRLPLHGRGVPA